MKSFQELKQEQCQQNVEVSEVSHKKNNIDRDKDPLGWELAQAFLTTNDSKLKSDLLAWANQPQTK